MTFVTRCENQDTGSDHTLVVAVLALKLRRAKLGEKRQKCFNVARLTDPDIKQKFNIALKNSYSVQNETEMDYTCIQLSNTGSRRYYPQLLENTEGRVDIPAYMEGN